MQIDRYIENGIVQTGIIANDVRTEKLSHQEIEEVLNDSRVKTAFIGIELRQKRPLEEWNEQYLDELFGMASMTCFNEDYLFFLEKVTQYVRRKQRTVKLIKRIAIGVCILQVLIFIVGKCSSNKSNDISTDSSITEVN